MNKSLKRSEQSSQHVLLRVTECRKLICHGSAHITTHHNFFKRLKEPHKRPLNALSTFVKIYYRNFLIVEDVDIINIQFNINKYW